MTKEEIRALIAAKITGQGTMVDAGGALPTILNAILDLDPGGGGGTPTIFTPLSHWETGTYSAADAASRFGLTTAEWTKLKTGKYAYIACYPDVLEAVAQTFWNERRVISSYLGKVDTYDFRYTLIIEYSEENNSFDIVAEEISTGDTFTPLSEWENETLTPVGALQKYGITREIWDGMRTGLFRYVSLDPNRDNMAVITHGGVDEVVAQFSIKISASATWDYELHIAYDDAQGFTFTVYNNQ